MVELIGTIGTLFILFGFTKNNARSIRIFNSIGSVFFVIYGLLLGAHNTYILNFIMIVVNLYKLLKEDKNEESSNLT